MSSIKPTTIHSQTRLDEVGRPASHIPAALVLAWKEELTTHPVPQRAALLHIWLGEWQLGQNQQPETARMHFRQAQHLLPYADSLYGLAAYDSAISLFYQGAYNDAVAAFSSLLSAQNGPKKSAAGGYDPRDCSLWLRHATACAGYHEEHSRLGIPEPTQLDPFCGVASLAACLRALSLPYDKPTLQKACRVTGEGSTMADLLASGKALNVSIRAVSADEQGLQRLPKPLVAYVERDHFVALVRADKAGVSYLCSDCGSWPGGRVDLTWKQWRTLNPGVYAAVTRPGSADDRLLAALTAPGAPAKGQNKGALLQISSRTGLRGLHLTERLHVGSSLAALRGHVVRFSNTGWLGCGFGVFCLPCFLQSAPLDSGPIPFAQPGAVFGPKAGDPVSLATGEEEYNPPADLTVYNPHGPSVTWSRNYRSLRPRDVSYTYQADDFGVGWSQPYNIEVVDGGSTQTLPQLQQAAATGLSAPGTDAPASGLSWDVLLNGATVASSASPNGWTAAFAYYGSPTLTPPSSAQVSTGYELRFFNTYMSANQSALFDVVPAASVAQNKSATFSPNGTSAPTAGLSWDVVQGSTTVATSASPNGWSVIPNSSGTGLSSFSVTAPQFAPLGSYTVRGTVSVGGYPGGSYPGGYPGGGSYTASASAAFSVYAVHYVATTGAKSVIMPNGAALAFTAPAVPTATTPRVQCSVQTGAPFLVEWDYAPGVFGGYFTVTMADRTKWVTTGFTGQYGSSGNRSFLSQIVDRNGNAINMVYGGLGTYSLPLLSAITDGAGSVLLNIARNGAAVSSVSDAYGRSVLYQAGSAGLGQVSQIVPTGTAAASAPARYTYGYVNVNNPEGEGGFYFLHTITVPSPTGSGTSTATINYVNGVCNVASIVDGNGNTRSYTACDADGTSNSSAAIRGGGNYTRVAVTNPQGTLAYSYVVGFDGNMNETSRTDGRTDGSGHYTNYVSQRVYSDQNDPYRPSAVYDGNGSTGVPSGAGPFVPQGRSAPVAVSSSTYVTTPSWQILLNGTAVATGATPNGWSVSYNSSASTFTIGAPASATAGSGYQVQYNTSGGSGSGYSYGSTGTFSVLAAGTKPATQYAWDPYGNLLSKTSPRGTTTSYTYSYASFGLGELTRAQEGSKSPTTYAYFEPSGLTQCMTAPLPGTTGSSQSATTSYTYDSLGNVLTITAPGNNASGSITTTFGYAQDGAYSQLPAIGQPLTVTNNLGKTAHLRYDAQGNVVAMKDPIGNETDQTYDIRNAPLQTTFPATGQTGSGHGGTQVSYLYAEPSALATAQWPAASLQYGPATTTTQYDEGNVGAIRQTVSAYGMEGEALSVSGSTEPVSYAYDAQYRRTKLTDGGGHTTSYFYNPAGYLQQVVYPGAQAAPPTAPLAAGSFDTITYPSYDSDGDRLSRVDGNNITTTYGYNAPDSRLTDITYPAGTLSAVHYAYDSYGRRSAMTDGTGGQTYAYDDRGDLTSKTVTYAGLPGQTLAYAFWPNGSRRAMTTSQGSFNYNYDAAGRMTSLTNPYNETSRWTYQDNGWLQTQTLGNGATTTYTRNALGLLTRLLNQTASGATLSDFGGPGGMRYDAAGNRLAVAVSVPSVPSLSGTTTYAYDYGQMAGPQANRSQLTQETSTRAGGYADTYGYDGTAQNPGGTANGPGNPTTLSAYSFNFNADNQNTNYTYDGNGNQSNPNSPNLYDPENRLTSLYGGTLTFASDADGHQAWEQSGNWRGYTIYDGEQPVLSLEVGGHVVGVTTFGPNGLLSVSSYGTGVFYTFDPSGNTSQRLNSSGGVDYSHLTSGYGVQRVHDGMSEQYDGFGAQWGYRDINSGLLFLLDHRYYNSLYGGQFLTRDSIGYRGGINLYGYTKNNPVNWTDPTGFCCLDPYAGPNEQYHKIGGGLGIVIGVGLGAVAGGAAGGFIGSVIGGGAGGAMGGWLGSETGDSLAPVPNIDSTPAKEECDVEWKDEHAGDEAEGGLIEGIGGGLFHGILKGLQGH